MDNEPVSGLDDIGYANMAERSLIVSSNRERQKIQCEFNELPLPPPEPSQPGPSRADANNVQESSGSKIQHQNLTLFSNNQPKEITQNHTTSLLRPVLDDDEDWSDWTSERIRDIRNELGSAQWLSSLTNLIEQVEYLRC